MWQPKDLAAWDSVNHSGTEGGENEYSGQETVDFGQREATMTRQEHNSGGLEWLDLRRLSEYAAVGERTLRSWIRLEVNPLPAVQVRGKILVRKSDFDRWLERHAIKQVDLGSIVEEMVEAVTDGR